MNKSVGQANTPAFASARDRIVACNENYSVKNCIRKIVKINVSDFL